jgi:hypothetical protein
MTSFTVIAGHQKSIINGFQIVLETIYSITLPQLSCPTDIILIMNELLFLPFLTTARRLALGEIIELRNSETHQSRNETNDDLSSLCDATNILKNWLQEIGENINLSVVPNLNISIVICDILCTALMFWNMNNRISHDSNEKKLPLEEERALNPGAPSFDPNKFLVPTIEEGPRQEVGRIRERAEKDQIMSPILDITKDLCVIESGSMAKFKAHLIWRNKIKKMRILILDGRYRRRVGTITSWRGSKTEVLLDHPSGFPEAVEIPTSRLVAIIAEKESQ